MRFRRNRAGSPRGPRREWVAWQRRVRWHQANVARARTPAAQLAAAFDRVRAAAARRPGLAADEVAAVLAEHALALWENGMLDDTDHDRLERRQEDYREAGGGLPRLTAGFDWYRGELATLRRVLGEDGLTEITDADMRDTARYLNGRAAELERDAEPARERARL